MLQVETPTRLAGVESRLAAPRIEQLWALVALAAPCIVTAGAAAFITDTWWALKMGQLSVETGRPVVDVVLAYAPAVPGAVNGQWLGQAALYVLYQALGEVGLRLVAGLVMTLSAGLLLATARIAGAGERLAAATVLLATLLSASNMAVRAQLFCYALFALTSLLLHLRRRQPRVLFALPAVFVLWANLHGSFGLGLLLVGLYAAGDGLELAMARTGGRAVDPRDLRRLALVLLAAALATSLNPLGPGLYVYVLTVLANPSVRDLVEWQPTTVHDITGQAFMLSVLLLFLAMRASRRPIAATEALLLLVFGYLALASMRNVVWWGLVLAPILAGHAAATPLARRLGRRPAAQPVQSAARARLNLTIAGLVVGLALLSPFWRPALAGRLQGSQPAATYAPSRAADFLTTLPAGSRLFQFQPWTGYLIWRLWPDQQLLVDGRIEAHPPAVWRDYLAISLAAADWERALERYEVEYLVLQPEAQRALLDLAEASGRWARRYSDETAVVLARQPAP